MRDWEEEAEQAAVERLGRLVLDAIKKEPAVAAIIDPPEIPHTGYGLIPKFYPIEGADYPQIQKLEPHAHLTLDAIPDLVEPLPHAARDDILEYRMPEINSTPEIPSRPEIDYQPPLIEATFSKTTPIFEPILGRLALENARLKELQEQHKAFLQELADTAREAGASWNDIGKALDITPQSAYQRWSEHGRDKHRENQRKRAK